MRPFTLHLHSGTGMVCTRQSAMIRFDPIFSGRWSNCGVSVQRSNHTNRKCIIHQRHFAFCKNPTYINKYLGIFVHTYCQNVSFWLGSRWQHAACSICIHTKHRFYFEIWILKSQIAAVSTVASSLSSTKWINLVWIPYLSLNLLHNLAFPTHASQSTSELRTRVVQWAV